MIPIRYSRGTSQFDNQPAQRKAANFAAFADAFLADRSATKGKTYICAPFADGAHNEPDKHEGIATWRQKHLALPRAFLPFDFDGFDTPEAFALVRDWLGRFQGFAYTTASHTPEAPRCRVVLAQSRETNREEGKALCLAVQAMIERDLGAEAVKFDESVYKAEQPLFTPLHGAEVFRFDGSPVDVDAVLAAAPPVDDWDIRPASTATERAAAIAAADPVLDILDILGMVKRDTGGGKYAVQCPCSADHTGESNESSTVYYLPNFGGVKYGKFHCLHDHCEDRPQEEFIEALGLNPREVWRQQAGGTGKPEVCSYAGGRFEVSERGVFFIGTDKDGEELPPLWVCSALHVRAMTRDAKSGEWGRLLEWHDKDGVRHQWAMPLELLQGDGADVRRELARLGLEITPGKKGRDLLAAFLQVWEVEARARCVDRLGWHGPVYVTPAESIGQAGELVVFQNAHAIEPAFSVAGTADDWRDSVARLAAGNSRLVFALSVAFAGPLADVVGEDSGGFHFRGSSSSGKTTALKAAASVWGSPSTYPRLWRATTNGLEGLAALHNDGLLILDELSQIDPKEAGEAAYLLANGQGKARASRTGTARQSARWRLLFLSAGEESLTALMARAGKKANAGQEIRLADIDADAGAGMGAFEVLHDQPGPAALALAVKDAATKYHGAAGVSWLRAVVAERKNIADSLPAKIRAFVQEAAPGDAAGQVLRVARRFALVACAGELATGYGLTGWADGEATMAAKKCFAAWLESFGGTGNREERAMLSQVRAFFEAHGASRFAHIDDTFPEVNQRIVNRAGFYRDTEGGEREYLVLPEVFRREVCQGFDEKRGKAALLDAGMLIPGKDGKPAQLLRLPGIGPTRAYVLRYAGGDE